MRIEAFSLSDHSLMYEQFRYPAGEFQVRLRELEAAHCADVIRVTARIADGNDIMKLALLTDALRGMNAVADYQLILPYLPYARADRRFVEGDCLGIAAFAGLINSLHYDEVATLDVHSENSGEFLNNLVNVSPQEFIIQAISKFAHYAGSTRVCVIYPDQGASKRYEVPSRVGDVDVYELHCHKRRDPVTGRLQSFTVPYASEIIGPVLLVDDICDGGGTFNGIAQALNEDGCSHPLGLYVTHGIFSQGFNTLAQNFRRIYTTDTLSRSTYPDLLTEFSTSRVFNVALNEFVTA